MRIVEMLVVVHNSKSDYPWELHNDEGMQFSGKDKQDMIQNWLNFHKPESYKRPRKGGIQ